VRNGFTSSILPGSIGGGEVCIDPIRVIAAVERDEGFRKAGFAEE
jgi:hypothetical protein